MPKCIVLLNCINTAEFEGIEASTPDPYKVLMVGRICKTKGQLQLINAFNIIVKSYPQAKLTLVGGVEDKNYFRLINKAITRLRLSDNIQYYPHISHHVLRQRFYSKHGIHVVLSDTAGTDLVVPEILASGRVLLITDIPSVREIVRHGKEAFLVNASDSEDIARGLLTLIQDNKLREKLSQNARQHAREIFECRNIARHLLQRVQALLRNEQKVMINYIHKVGLRE
jgi:glycosyltransferase involved in cell wall biosynthesis